MQSINQKDFFLSIFIAYFIFNNPVVHAWVLSLNKFSLLGAFIAGIFITFGFSAPLSIGFFVSMSPENIFLCSILGGVGAMVGTLIIFKTIRYSFQDEFNQLNKTKVIKEIREIVTNNPHVLIRHYLLYLLAGIIIATPLPDEIGVSMLAGLTTIKPYMVALISFILHALVIFLILYFI